MARLFTMLLLSAAILCGGDQPSRPSPLAGTNAPAYANRALADDLYEDGKGGWTDQGPGSDLRTFPTGAQTFKQIPFKIGTGAHSSIVLAAEGRPGSENMP